MIKMISENFLGGWDMHSYISSLDLQGPQGKLNNVFYPTPGDSPKPLLIFAHGFPGHEKNFTLAQDLRDHGFHVLIFFFSGCWGSAGNFSFKNSIDDLDAVLDFLLAHPQGKAAEGKLWTLDPENLYILVSRMSVLLPQPEAPTSAT